LSGSVRRAASLIRIAAELADAENGLVLWAQTFDFDSQDLFDIQDRITAEIVAIIAPRVQDAQVKRAFLKRPENMDAYDHVMQALALLFRLTREDFNRAGVLLQRAIALDDSYAASYALAAEWHGLRRAQGWSPSSDADGTGGHSLGGGRVAARSDQRSRTGVGRPLPFLPAARLRFRVDTFQPGIACQPKQCVGVEPECTNLQLHRAAPSWASSSASGADLCGVMENHTDRVPLARV
jgi:hypothetical protein